MRCVISAHMNRRVFLGTGAAALGAVLMQGCRRDVASHDESAATQAPASTTALLVDPVFQGHITGPGHPESPRRLAAIHESLRTVEEQCLRIEPRLASEAELLACHDEAYLQLAQREIEAGAPALSTGDTMVSADSWRIASLAAGGIMSAVDAVVTGKARNAFCAVRPPGHHAGPARGMGFCILNNIALAARYAQRKHGLAKVLVVDWDVHHGNGTQEIFDADPSVLFFDTHQHPWYPGTGGADEVGTGAARGTKINVPLPAGSGRKEIIEAYESKLLPAVARFQPEMVFVSAGFDSRIDDPLGKFTLTDEDFADMTRMVTALADQYAGGRLVSVLEGGYAPEDLASATLAHVRALLK